MYSLSLLIQFIFHWTCNTICIQFFLVYFRLSQCNIKQCLLVTETAYWILNKQKGMLSFSKMYKKSYRLRLLTFVHRSKIISLKEHLFRYNLTWLCLTFTESTATQNSIIFWNPSLCTSNISDEEKGHINYYLNRENLQSKGICFYINLKAYILVHQAFRYERFWAWPKQSSFLSFKFYIFMENYYTSNYFLLAFSSILLFGLQAILTSCYSLL